MSATSKVVFYGENPGVRLGPSADPDTMTTRASTHESATRPAVVPHADRRCHALLRVDTVRAAPRQSAASARLSTFLLDCTG